MKNGQTFDIRKLKNKKALKYAIVYMVLIVSAFTLIFLSMWFPILYYISLVIGLYLIFTKDGKRRMYVAQAINSVRLQDKEKVAFFLDKARKIKDDAMLTDLSSELVEILKA